MYSYHGLQTEDHLFLFCFVLFCVFSSTDTEVEMQASHKKARGVIVA
jgi:gamma-glutamylcysteine synthetase